MTNPICPYCNKESDAVDGTAIYPHRPDLSHKWFYQCVPCDAYVGCHPGTKNSLGRLANAELRKWKSIAHQRECEFKAQFAKERDELQKRVDALKGLVIELKKLDMENGSIEITSEFVEEIICDFEQALKGGAV